MARLLGRKRGGRHAGLGVGFQQDQTIQTPRFDRLKLRAADTVAGPAVIVQQNSTTIVPPGFVATVMKLGDLVIARAGQEG